MSAKAVAAKYRTEAKNFDRLGGPGGDAQLPPATNVRHRGAVRAGGAPSTVHRLATW